MSKGATAKPRREYRVGIDLELPADVFERIGRSIQRAVLAELADVDLAEGYSVLLRGLRDEALRVEPGRAVPAAGGPLAERGGEIGIPGADMTDGIWIREEEERLP